MKKLKSEWKIEAILDPELENLKLIPAFIVEIQEKKQISNVVKNYAQNFPLQEEFLYLKRVKISATENRTFIIVSLGENQPQNFQVNGVIKNSLVKVEVPGKKPRTRDQFEKSKNFWPCHFHEDKKIEAILGHTLPEVWADKAFDMHCTNMQRVFDSDQGTLFIFWKALHNKHKVFSAFLVSTKESLKCKKRA